MRHRPKQFLLAILLLVGLLSSACAPEVAEEAVEPPEVEEPEPVDVEDDVEGLIIDGEEIADAELWEAAQSEGGFTFYTALIEVQEIALVGEFERQTGLVATLAAFPGGQLFERIQSEHGAGVLDADLIRQTDRGLMEEHLAAGILAEHCPPAWDEIPAEVKSEGCEMWASVNSAYILGYNTRSVDEADAPRTWDDLLDERWTNNLGMAHIGAGGSTWARDLFLRLEKGVEYWEQLADQNPILSGSAATIAEQLGRGEFDVAAVLPGIVSIFVEEGAPIAVNLPEDGLPVFSYWIGLAADAENENAAKVFLNWQASLAGQRAVAEVAGDFPVRPDAPDPIIGGVTVELDPALLKYPEATQEFFEFRDEWNQEWFAIFGFTPED
jgi:iron(III) transport system substrate-binding protein